MPAVSLLPIPLCAPTDDMEAFVQQAEREEAGLDDGEPYVHASNAGAVW